MRHPYVPSPEAELVLRAGLAPEAEAAAAWRTWRSTRTLDDAHPALLRLLPLAHANLPGAAMAPEDRGRVAGLRRRAFYVNQTSVRTLGALLGRAVPGYAPPMLLKGLAVALTVPGGMGTRTMRDLDVLVRPADVDAVHAALRAAGAQGELPVTGLRRILHATPVGLPDGTSVDLHWRAMHRAADDTPLWTAARTQVVHDVPVLLPSPEDLVLHACVHGMSPDATPYQWIPDVVLCVRAAGDAFDWRRVVDEAVRLRVELPVRAALRVLHDRFALPVPVEALRALRPRGLQPGQRLLHHLATRGRRGRVPQGLWQFELYRRDALARGERVTPAAYAAVLADVAQLDDARRLPGHWGRRARALAAGRG